MSTQQLDHEQTNWTEKSHSLILACDSWHDPRNVGMAFRLADAFGVQEIWLGRDTPVPPNTKLSRSARRSERWVPYVYQEDLIRSLLALKAEKNAQIWALEITNTSMPIQKAPTLRMESPVVLVVGAERHGISLEVLQIVDSCFHIEMYGRNSSLNVATALGIALFELTRCIPNADLVKT